MTAKCFCNQCSAHLEFDTDHAGEMITCPSCGMETKLYIPPPATSAGAEAPVSTPAPISQGPEDPPTRLCPGCKSDIATKANFCPKCGHRFAAAESETASNRVMIRLIVCCLCVASAIGITVYSFTLHSSKTPEELRVEESTKQMQKSTHDALKASQDLDAAMQPRK
jgi:hypothetical protein